MKDEILSKETDQASLKSGEKVQENILGTERIGKLLAKFAIPGIVSMVINALYNIVDQIFIGHSEAGFLGNGATTVIFPMTCLAMAFAMLFGDGAASYISLKLGQGDKESAAKGVSAGIIGFLGTNLILAAVYLMFMEPMCRIFGSSEEILPLAKDYGRIISYGIPLLAICAGGASIIRADGSPLFNMVGLISGCVINIVLDALFIFKFHMGVKGAAWATILGQAFNALLNIWYVFFRIKSVKLNGKIWLGGFSKLWSVARLGISSFINQIALVIGIASRNNILVSYGAMSKYGPSIPITTLGITMKSFNIIMCIVFGLCGGAQPIYGFNYGARKYDRVKKAFKIVLILSTAVSVLGFLVSQIFPKQILDIFGQGDELYEEFGVKCMRIFLMLIPVFGMNVASGVFFQALGRPVQSALISFSKQIIFQLPFTFILPVVMEKIWPGRGVEGVLWTGPVSDVLSMILTGGLLIAYWKKIFRNDSKILD